MTDDEFLKERHRAFNTPEALVFEAVQKATGQEPVERQKIVAGYDNEVYNVRTAVGREFILRIRHFGGLSFEQEAWAMKCCREVGVPVPEVLSIATIPGEDRPLEAMVLNKLEGVSLASLLPNLDAANSFKLLGEAGEVLRKIHSIGVGGCYRRHDDGQWDFPDCHSLMDASIRDRIKEEDIILSAGFTGEEFGLMIEIMRSYKISYSDQKPVLNHGDYLPGHIFVKDHRVSGIIDFGGFQGGPPINDLALIRLQEPLLNLEPLLRGYAGGNLPDDRFMEGIEMCKLGLQIGWLAYNTKIGNRPEAHRLSTDLRMTLRTLTRVS